MALACLTVLWLAACTAGTEPRTTALITPAPGSTLALTSTALPTPETLPPTATGAIVATVTPDERPGVVTGSLCYPSSRPPPITLYLQDSTSGVEIELELAQGQTSFAVELPPGEYVAYAHTVGTELAGGYTQGIPCQNCGQELRAFNVEPGTTTAGIDLCDWYDPPRIQIDAADQNGAAVWVTTLQNMKVFSAPTLASPDLAVVPPRTAVEAVARNAAGSWLQADFANAGTAWISAPLTLIRGRPDALPVVAFGSESPTVETKKSLADRNRFVPTTWVSGYNESIVHFKGYIRDEVGQPVNGFPILLDNGTWSVLSHPTGASRHYPDVEDGAWDLVITNAADAAGWWALTVVSYDCPDFESGFNAQCKQFTPLSNTEVVRVIYPDENVVDADWLCRFGCNQGLYVEPYRRP